ncbi:MAG TPA: cytochrome P450 [Acidimicrobiales bacterium]
MVGAGPDAAGLEDRFSLLDARLAEDFHGVMGELRRHCPVPHSPDYAGYWVLTKYDDVRLAARDWKTFSSADGVRPHMHGSSSPLTLPEESDPPVHDLWRHILNPYFSPGAVGALLPAIARIADELLDEASSMSEVDLADAFARPLPLRVIFEQVLDLPADMAVECRILADRAVFGVDVNQSVAAAKALHDVACQVITAAGPDTPGSPIVEALRVATIDGQPAKLADKSSVLMLLIMAGLETTTNLINGALWRLAEDPAVFGRLQADPSIIPSAVEEFVRHEGVVAFMGRRLTRDIEVRGRQLAKGEWVMLSFASANRDSEEFDDADTFDIERSGNRHIGFGAGIHRCLGSHLARAEMIVALERFVARVAEMHLVPGARPAYSLRIARGLRSVPTVVRWV